MLRGGPSSLAVKGGNLGLGLGAAEGLALSGQRPGNAHPGPSSSSSGQTAGTSSSSSYAPHRMNPDAALTLSAAGAAGATTTTEKYWKNPIPSSAEDVVLIHVCDENRQLSKDFCCKRNILVKHMRYFERFLAENENGYDDIDISVHCDVEIFEWLMSYIHEPDKPPVLDKAIVVSILISSEFLQMETLVDLCLDHIAASLGEIIRLPIDLSCISDKLVNKLAMLISPKVLAQTKDRKDKILNKLYKRRVELDFSRKSGARGGSRTIAASLTCCRYCGMVYLDNWVSMLTCRSSPPAVDYRGYLARRHAVITGWSLTSYLKTLHAGGMSWDAIYWHVWGACEVFLVGDVMVSALEVDRYTIEPDGLLIRSRPLKEGAAEDAAAGSGSASLLPPRPRPSSLLPGSGFSLDADEDDGAPIRTFKLRVQPADASLVPQPPSLSPASPSSSSAAAAAAASAAAAANGTLNPLRPPDVLPQAVFELLSSQARLIAGTANRQLIDQTAKQIVQSAANAEEFRPFDYGDLLWADLDAGAGAAGGGDDEWRGRSRTPPRASRKVSQSLTAKLRERESSGPDSDAEKEKDGKAEGKESSAATGAQNPERRSRSMGTNFRLRATGSKRAPGAAVARVGQRSSAELTVSDLATQRQLAILNAVPPDATRRFNVNKGPVYGVWFVPHPLKLYPSAYADLMNTVQESGVSDNKKLEWELDLLREYDEKRLDRFEAFLVSKRNASESQARTASVTKSIYYKQSQAKAQEGGAAAGAGPRDSQRKGDAGRSYYLDKGRQPTKVSMPSS